MLAQDDGRTSWRELPGQRGPAIAYLSSVPGPSVEQAEALPGPSPRVPAPARTQPAAPPEIQAAPALAPAAPVVYSDAADAPAAPSDVAPDAAPDPAPGDALAAGTLALADGSTLRYQFTLPPSARLDYTRTVDGSGEEGSAHLGWQHDGESYRLELSGFPDNTQSGGLPAASAGTTDDYGIAPREAVERAGLGSSRNVVFDRASAAIAFDGSAGPPLLQGTQDRASMLMQLAGIGLESAEQMRHAIDLYVAAAGQARLVRFEVGERSTLHLPAGRFETVHLVEQAAPGGARIELWLAPSLSWLPVQLRHNGPSGAGQTLRLRQHSVSPPPSGVSTP